MTKISNQYSLTNILTADLANSRLGINNVSPAYSLDVTGAGKFSSSLLATSYNATTTNIFSVDGSEKMRIKSNGNVGIGTTVDIDHKLKVAGIVNSANGASDSVGGGAAYLLDGSATSGSSLTFLQQGVSKFSIWTYDGSNWGNRMSITSGGNVLIGTTTDNSFLLDVAANTTNFAAMVRNITSSACNGLYIYFPNSTFSTTSQAFLRGESAAGLKAMIYTNGSYGSATGTYGSIVSDLRLKENISEATSKLNDILKLRVVNFNITADLDKKKQIGFIAQEFKEVFPSLVFETDTREYDKNGNVIKGLENAMGLSVGMEFAILTKAIQELSAKVSLLENK